MFKRRCSHEVLLVAICGQVPQSAAKGLRYEGDALQSAVATCRRSQPGAAVLSKLHRGGEVRLGPREVAVAEVRVPRFDGAAQLRQVASWRGPPPGHARERGQGLLQLPISSHE